MSKPTGARRKSGHASGSRPVKSTRGEFSSPLDSGFQSPPRPCRLLVAPGRRSSLGSPRFSSVLLVPGSWGWGGGVSDKDAELCIQLLGKHSQVGAAGRRRGERAPAGPPDRGTRVWRSAEPEPCALSSKDPFCCAPSLLLLLLLTPHTGRTHTREGHVETACGAAGASVRGYRALRAPCPAVSSLLLGRDHSASASPRLRLSAAG
ncbi:unnamed protein product [Pleuronectes platessa]|uniref:Uncharacterized protein n=1 Tax=Pleuronectes platessa TaxID=8262 RepID=A0A9N7YUF9_PLEPL|nr:unnamed protein product [Pleuronectes platessa]